MRVSVFYDNTLNKIQERVLLTLLISKENRNFRHIPMGMREKTCANPLKEQRFFPSRQHCLAEVFRYLLTYLTYWSAGRANWPMRCSLEVICVHMFAPERRPCALTDANGSVCVRKCAHLSFRRALTDANAPQSLRDGGTHYIKRLFAIRNERLEDVAVEILVAFG